MVTMNWRCDGSVGYLGGGFSRLELFEMRDDSSLYEGQSRIR
jgi:hypothetical protein